MVRFTTRVGTALALLAVLLFLTSTTRACPFCSLQGKTLTGEVEQASMVVVGTLKGADEKLDKTDIDIDTVVKDNEIRAKKTTITLKKYIPPEADGGKYKYVVFCDIFKGNIDPYRGIAVKADSKIAEYLQGALSLKTKPIGERLRFFFNYLDNSDLEISNDAYKEFANADYADYRDMAKTLPADRIVEWLKDPKTPAFRLGLYASMLGHCGKATDGAVLRTMLDDPARRVATGIDGMMAGYVMLQPQEGWKYMTGVLGDEKKEFMFRYAALRAVRFLHDSRPDIVQKKDLIDGACRLLDQSDMADLAIEDLRKWQQWDRAERVLGVLKTAAGKEAVVSRSVLRYCLQCKGNAAAAIHVAERRKADAEGVKDVEELLKLEEAPAEKPAPR
jgi:hypothetical protein